MPKYHYSAVQTGRGTDASFGFVEAANEGSARKEVQAILRIRRRKGLSRSGSKYRITITPAQQSNPKPGTKVQTTVKELKRIYRAGLRKAKIAVKLHRPATQTKRRNPRKSGHFSIYGESDTVISKHRTSRAAWTKVDRLHKSRPQNRYRVYYVHPDGSRTVDHDTRRYR